MNSRGSFSLDVTLCLQIITLVKLQGNTLSFRAEPSQELAVIQKCSVSALSDPVATSHVQLLSTGTVASVTGTDVHIYFILVHLHLNTHG